MAPLSTLATAAAAALTLQSAAAFTPIGKNSPRFVQPLHKAATLDAPTTSAPVEGGGQLDLKVRW